jgi:hypothetical protein
MRHPGVRVSYSGRPPAGYTLDEIAAFEDCCLAHVKEALAPGAALRTEMERVSHKDLISIELERDDTPMIVTTFVMPDGSTGVQKSAIWGLDPVPPDPRNLNEARQTALIIAVNAAEPSRGAL